MGKLSGKVHKLIVTDDNPRTEEPAHIRNQIAQDSQNIWIIPCRSDALQVAFSFADRNKIVLILAHGSEEYVLYGNHYSCLTDRQVFEYFNLRMVNR